MTQAFHHALDEICSDLVGMAGTVVESIPRATEVLLTGDLAGADAIINADKALNDRALDLEERCYDLLALNQPMASDLRRLMTVIKMVGEIERSGDLVVNICKAARRLYHVQLDPKLRGRIARMGEHAAHLFQLAIEAFADDDAAKAAALNDIDDLLDGQHRDYIRTIFECHSTEGLELQVAVQLALVGRFYERIGDHAVNIGERVHFMVTGDLSVPHDDRAPAGVPAGDGSP